jgi:hypothetical protein
MRRSLISPTALGGYGAIILTVVIFFSQGGFGEMTSLTYLYIIGFVVGIGLVIFSLIKVNGGKDKISKKGLNSIVPTLEKMDSLLREQAKKEAKTPIDLQGYTNFNAKINAEIFGIKPVTDIEPQSMRRLAQKEAIRMIQKYGNKKDKWFQQAKTLSGAYDINGYGLKVFRDRGRYKKLLRMLTTNRNYVTDELLNTLIKKHI